MNINYIPFEDLNSEPTEISPPPEHPLIDQLENLIRGYSGSTVNAHSVAVLTAAATLKALLKDKQDV